MKKSKEFSMTLTKDNVTCPISLQVFLEPAIVHPCGHLFEMKEIKRWLEEKNNCPCCRKKIETMDFAPAKTQRRLQKILDANPAMYDDCYFTIDLFCEALTQKDHPTLQKMLNVLRNSEKCMNTVSEEKSYSGCTPAYCLAAYNIELLWDDPSLCKKISATGLNAVIRGGENQGFNTFFWLSGSEVGQKILARELAFLSMVDEAGLNAIVQRGNHVGRSPASNLLDFEKGRKLLLQAPELCEKINEKILNAIYYQGNARGLSAIFALANTPTGLKILADNPSLCKKINKSGLNAIGDSKNYEGYSPVYALLKNTAGRQLLLKNAHLRQLISERALFSVIKVKGADEGRSAGYWLKHTPEGKELLLADPSLQKKLKKEKSSIVCIINFFLCRPLCSEDRTDQVVEQRR